MEKKYISESRYKKSTKRKRRDISAITKAKCSTNMINTRNVKKTSKSRIKPSIRKERRITRRNIIMCIVLLILMSIILRALLKEEGEPFIPIFFGTEENEQVITVGIVTDEDLINSNTSNVVLTELGYYSNYMLLAINEDYTLNYDAIKSIEKTSAQEYIIKIKETRAYDAHTIKRKLESYINDVNSIYYSKLKDIKEIVVQDDENIKIVLNNNNPYFIYNLDVPIAETNKKYYSKADTSNSSMIEYERTKYASEIAPKKIIVKRYKDMYAGVEAYKKQEINMLITNQKNVQNMLGKYEYNLKTYRTGETIFMFLNSESELLKNDEIRRAIAYSIDRDSIVKDVFQSCANVIDLPYIYDNVKYKYDIYAAENLLLSNGYKKSYKIYSKAGKQIALTLVVNKSDTEKLEIANVIKNNLSSVGIKINVEKLSTSDVEKTIKKGDYDLVLSSVNLNNNPNIEFLNNNIYITDEVGQTINSMQNANPIDLSEKINSISKAMSKNISCIGIISKTSSVIYNKDITGISDISYLNIFKSLIVKED